MGVDMVVGDVILALVLATLFATIFGVMGRSREGVPGALPIFILFFLFAWAGGLWLRPIGPPLFGRYWVPGLLMVALIFLLLAALAGRSSRTDKDMTEQKEIKYSTAAAVGTLFWLLVGVLLIAVIFGYMV
jgi:hypothetical protein